MRCEITEKRRQRKYGLFQAKLFQVAGIRHKKEPMWIEHRNHWRREAGEVGRRQITQGLADLIKDPVLNPRSSKWETANRSF